MQKQSNDKKTGSSKKCADLDFDYALKMIIIGDSGVGKSSIMVRFNENKFSENHMATIGINHSSKTLTIDDLKIKLHVWDTAGQQKFRNITKNYYRSAQGAIVAFSINSLESYYSVGKSYKYIGSWIDELNQIANENIPYILIGTKKDLESQRVISYDEAQEFASNHNISYFESSAKNNVGIDEAFTKIAKLMKQNSIDKKLHGSQIGVGDQSVKIGSFSKNFQQKCCQS